MAKHLNRAAPSSTTSNISDQALTPDEPRVSTKSAGTARSALPVTAGSSDAWAAFRGRLGQLLSALVVCSFAFVHPLHAALRTGRPDAYLATELGWSGRKPEEGHLIFIQWVKQLDEYLGGSLPWEIVALFFVALILGFYWWISLKGNRSLLHPALWLWTACYAGYLFIFWLPITSTPRIILPMFTLSLLVASYLPKSRVYRPGLVLLGVLASAAWVHMFWGGPDTIRNIWFIP